MLLFTSSFMHCCALCYWMHIYSYLMVLRFILSHIIQPFANTRNLIYLCYRIVWNAFSFVRNTLSHTAEGKCHHLMNFYLCAVYCLSLKSSFNYTTYCLKFIYFVIYLFYFILFINMSQPSYRKCNTVKNGIIVKCYYIG